MTIAAGNRLTAANDNNGNQTTPAAMTGLVHLLARAQARRALSTPANRNEAPAPQGKNA